MPNLTPLTLPGVQGNALLTFIIQNDTTLYNNLSTAISRGNLTDIVSSSTLPQGEYSSYSNGVITLNANILNLAAAALSSGQYTNPNILTIANNIGHETFHADNDTYVNNYDSYQTNSYNQYISQENVNGQTVTSVDATAIVNNVNQEGALNEDGAMLAAYNSVQSYISGLNSLGGSAQASLNDNLNAMSYTFGSNQFFSSTSNSTGLNPAFSTDTLAGQQGTFLTNVYSAPAGSGNAANGQLTPSDAGTINNLGILNGLYYNNPSIALGYYGGTPYYNYNGANELLTLALGFAATGQNYQIDYNFGSGSSTNLPVTVSGIVNYLANFAGNNTSAQNTFSFSVNDTSAQNDGNTYIFSYAPTPGAPATGWATVVTTNGNSAISAEAAGIGGVVSQSGVPVTIDQGSSATVSGSSDLVTLNGSATALNGGGQNTYLENASDPGLNGYVPEPVTVSGAASLTATSGVLNVGAAPGASNLDGVSVNVADNGDVNLDNTGATVTMGQNSSVYVTDGATAQVSVSGTSLSGSLTGNPTGSTLYASTNGTTGTLTLEGSGAALNVSGTGQAIVNGASNTVTLTDTVTAVNQAGQTNTFVENASDDGVVAAGGAPSAVQVNGAASITSTDGVPNVAAAPGATSLDGATINVGAGGNVNLDSSGATANLQDRASAYVTPGATAQLTFVNAAGNSVTTTVVSNPNGVDATYDASTGTLTQTDDVTGAVLSISGGSASVDGNGDQIQLASGATADENGNGDTTTLSPNAQAILNGMNEAVTAPDGNGNVQLAQNSAVTFTGNSSVISDVSGATGGSVTANGGGNTVNASPDEQVVVGSTNNTFDSINVSGDAGGSTVANGSSSGVFLSSNSQANLIGSDNAIYFSKGAAGGIFGGGNAIYAGADELVYVASTNNDPDAVFVSGDVGGQTLSNGDSSGIDLTSNSQTNLVGSDNSIYFSTGAVGGIYGGGNTIYAGADELVYVASTDNDLDTIYVSGDSGGQTLSDGDNSGINLTSNSQANLVGSDNAISFSGDDSLTLDGNSNTVSDANATGDTVSASGTNEVFNLTGATIIEDASSSANISGNNTENLVNGSGNTINISGNSTTDIDGPDTVNINPASSDNLDLFSGPVTFNTGTGTPFSPTELAVLNGLGNSLSSATMNSNTDATYSGSDQNVTIAGTNITANGISGGNVQENGYEQSVINASSSKFTIGVGATITINGSNNNNIVSGSNATIYQNTGSITLGAYVSGVAIHGNNLTIIEDYLSDSSVYGTGDVIHTREQPNYAVDAAATPSDPNAVVGFAPGGTGDSVVSDGSGYGAYGGYGFSEAPPTTGTNIGIIASFDAQLGDQSEAISASSAALQAQSNLASATGAKTDTPEFEGAKWASKTITWSLATTYDPIGAQLSGLISTQYVPLIQQAFHDWSVISGLNFKQVAASASPDIELGWSTFNPAVTGVLGYTGFSYMNGALQSGALISLENPADDPLAEDSSGQLAYTGTQTELEQLVLHQIGQALGLADDSDPKSIMYAVLNAANRTLDATDIEGIQALYEPTTIAATTASATAAVTTGLSDIASLVSSSPITVASSLISSLTSSALTPFAAEADQLIDAMASFSPTASPATFIPTTLASVASGMTLATAGG